MRRQSALIDDVLVTRFIEPPQNAPAPVHPDTLFIVSNGVNGLEWDAVRRAEVLASLTGSTACAMLRPGTGGTVTDRSTLRELRDMKTYDLTNRIAKRLRLRTKDYDGSIKSFAFIDTSAAAKQAVDLATMGSLPVSMLGLYDPVDRLNLTSRNRVLPQKLCQQIGVFRGVSAWRNYKKSELPLAYAEPDPSEPERPPFWKSLRTEVMLYGHRWSTGQTGFNLGSLATEARIPTRLVLPRNTFNGTPEEVDAEAENLNDLRRCIRQEGKQPFIAEIVDDWHNMLDPLENYTKFASESLQWWLDKTYKS